MKTKNLSVEGLENGTSVETTVDYSDRKYLESNKPSFPKEFVSSKFNAIGETEVQAGVAIMSVMFQDINPLVILLAKWWEVKPARAAIKKMIDQEADDKCQPRDYYLQEVLRKPVDLAAALKRGIERASYAITYFKPRDPKEVFKVMKINGSPYNVSLKELAIARSKFGEDTKSIKEYLLSLESTTKFEVADEI
jgi:hypothetical protein